MELTFEQQAGDLLAFNYYNAWSKPENRTKRNRSRLRVIIIAALAVLGVRLFSDEWDWTLTGLLGGTALVYVLVLDQFVKMRVHRHVEVLIKKSSPGLVTGPRTWQVSQQGIQVNLAQGNQTFTWKQVSRIVRTKYHWMLYLDGKQALVLPKRALDSPEKHAQWQEMIRPLALRKHA